MTCNDVITKICSKCYANKPPTEFYKYKRNTDGHQSHCKVCQKERVALFRLTKTGIVSVVYDTQKKHSKARGHSQPAYSASELKEWMFNQPKFHALYEKWVLSSYESSLKPSCDRLNDYKGYSLGNLQLMTWGEDRKNGINNKASKSVIQLTKDGEFIAEYYSMKQAERRSGVRRTDISNCCRGVQKTAYGFRWEYKCCS